MKALLNTEFEALLALAGITPRQVNNWARGRADVPKWAAVLAAALAEFTPEALEIMVEAADFSWAETLGVAPNADASLVRRAITKLALTYHPDKGGTQDQMTRINAAYEKARS
jgi:DnaJ-domain-containing protein 1